MAAQFKIDQVGLPSGSAGFSRTDGLITGALVTITRTAGGDPASCYLRYVPPDDDVAVGSLTKTGADTWTFTPKAGVWGKYLVELVTDEGTAAEERKRLTLGIRSPVAGLLRPAANETADRSAHLQNISANLISRSNSNEPHGPYATGDPFGWLRDLDEAILQVEATAAGVGGADLDAAYEVGEVITLSDARGPVEIKDDDLTGTPTVSGLQVRVGQLAGTSNAGHGVDASVSTKSTSAAAAVRAHAASGSPARALDVQSEGTGDVVRMRDGANDVFVINSDGHVTITCPDDGLFLTGVQIETANAPVDAGARGVTLQTGDGGNYSAGSSREGGAITNITGDGGDGANITKGTAAADGGQWGVFTGDGGAAAASPASDGGDGGPALCILGSGGPSAEAAQAAGKGGSWSLSAGDGGTHSAGGQGGAGGDFAIEAGDLGTGSPNGAKGEITLGVTHASKIRSGSAADEPQWQHRGTYVCTKGATTYTEDFAEVFVADPAAVMTTDISIFVGNGNPDGQLTAGNLGSLCMTDLGHLYRKTSDSPNTDWRDVGEDAEKFSYPQATPAGTPLAEYPFWIVDHPITIKRIRIICDANVAAHDTNNWTITVYKRDGVGGGRTAVASLTLNTAAGNVTQWQPKDLGSITGGSVDSPYILTFEKTEGGSGLNLPRFTVVVDYVRD